MDTIRATAEHPFWVQAPGSVAGEWVNAGDLVAGATLLTADGTTATVLDVKGYDTTEWAYNFTVADLHTYFVGDEPVLVHNAGPGCVVPSTGIRPQLAASYRATSGGHYPTYTAAVTAAMAKKSNTQGVKCVVRGPCGRGNHVHVDIYNRRNQLLETVHYYFRKR